MIKETGCMSAKVSIIIATFRRYEDFRNALHSAIKQSYKNCEIIVVDDNDDLDWNAKVAEIVFSEAKDSQVPINLICNHPNQGSAKTRNIGINAANGDYICFLDDDDVYLPNRVENQILDMVNKSGDYGITDLILYNEDGSINEYRKRNYLLSAEKDNLLLCHLKYHMTGTDTLMFRRTYINSFGGFDPIDSGDEYYLMIKALTANGRFIYTPQCDVKAYVHKGENGLSSGKSKINGEKKLFKYKKRFWCELNWHDKRFIVMRHYAVLAYAYLRMHKTIPFGFYGFLSFFIAPVQCLKMLKGRNL